MLHCYYCSIISKNNKTYCNDDTVIFTVKKQQKKIKIIFIIICFLSCLFRFFIFPLTLIFSNMLKNVSIKNRSIFRFQTLSIYKHNTCLTLWVFYFDVRCGATEGHGDLLEAGVKGHLPRVADPTEVISGQQVDFRRLHGLLHPFKDLRRWIKNVKNAGNTHHL